MDDVDKNGRVQITQVELEQLIADAVHAALSEHNQEADDAEFSFLASDEKGFSPLFSSLNASSLLSGAARIFEHIQVRFRGEYETDDYGYDPQFAGIVQPLIDFFYQSYFRCQLSGIQHIPVDGPAIIVSNDGSIIPVGGLMLLHALKQKLPDSRPKKVLYLRWMNTIPFLGEFLQGMGFVMDSPENLERMVGDDSIILLFPEGQEGAKKLYRHRDLVTEFEKREFITIAVKKNIPLLPCAIVGIEDAFPQISRIDWLGKMLNIPSFPVMPSLFPLPVRWQISIMEPIFPQPIPKQFATDESYEDFLSHALRYRIQARLTDIYKKKS